MVDFILQKKGVMRNTLEKVMNQTYLKNELVAVKVSPSTKSPTAKSSSVVTRVNPSTYWKDKEVYPDESPFEVGSIVSIKVSEIDGYRFKNRYTAPIFYEIVEETTLLGDIGGG